MNARCLINLTELTEQTTIQAEYSAKGVKELTGSLKTRMQLPFTRASFAREQPSKQQGMSISGYQPKLSLAINEQYQFEVVEALGQFILKPSPENFPFLAENEHASMMVMKELGFDVPPFGLVRFQQDEHGKEELAFIIKRFDRSSTHSKIHQEQLDSAMGISDKYGKVLEDEHQAVSYQQIGRFLTERVDSSLATKRDFFERVILSYLIGNNDLHLRNFGILYPPGQAPAMAPVYDYVSVAPFDEFNSSYLALPLLSKEESDGELADGFNSDYGQYIGADFIEFGIGIGLREKAATQFLSELLNRTPFIESIYQKSFLQGEALNKVLACIRHRTRCLKEFALV